jgi:hypothetical protein
MFKRNKELWLALLCMVLIGGIYGLVVVWTARVPAAGSLFGHLLGVLGFILMLMTELLYSLRKRSHTARWGRMSDWLEFHIFTGLVGPFMVLLHTSWKFQGLAGVVMLMTLVIVLSGFVGRYIYTSLPRTIDGSELQAEELKQAVTALDQEVKRLEEIKGIEQGETKEYRIKVDGLNKDLERLRRQEKSLVNTRRLLAIWHLLHIPIGMALFTSAIIHMGAAIYYATLLK